MVQNQVTSLYALLRATDAEIRILRAIRCPTYGEGLIPALELTETSLAALANSGQLPRAEQWYKTCRDLLTKCEGLQEEHTSFGLLRSDQSFPVFGTLARKPKCQLAQDAEQRTVAVLGRLIASAVSTGTALNVASIEAWATLRRCGKPRKGRNPDWDRIAGAIPLTLPDTKAAIELTSVQALQGLLEDLAFALNTALIDPSSIAQTTPSDTSGEAFGTDSSKERQAPEPKENEDDEDENEAPEADPKDKNKADEEQAGNSPTGWLVNQANHARHTQLFGLIGDRDRLHPETLRLVCRRLMASFFAGDNDTRDKVALAHLSLKSGLPAKLAIRLPFEPVSYPCLDIERGELIWNYRLALDSNSDTLDKQLPPRGDVELIRIALDADVAEHLRMRLLERPDASDAGVLFGVGADVVHKPWWRAYREFLHGCGDPRHPAYDARFSRSGGDVYRHVCGSDIVAAFMAQDFQGCAMGLLHYTTFPATFLQVCNERVHKFLGFRTAVTQPDQSFKGASISITQEEFRQGWEKLQASTRDALGRLESATMADELVEAFNNLASYRLVSLITLVAHRGFRLARLTWRALYTHQQLIHIFDKNVGNYQSDRVVPAHALADRLLACWQADLQLFRKRSAEIGLSLRKEGKRAFEATSADQPVFLHVQTRLENDTICIIRKPICQETLVAAANHCFGRPLNIGRHFLVSQLLTRGVDTWLVRVLTGHSRSHAEPFSDAMGVPPKFALERLRSAMDKLFASLDLAQLEMVGNCPMKRDLVVPSGRIPFAEEDRYLHPSISAGLRVLPPPFDVHSLVSIRVVNEARSELVARRPHLAAGPMLVAMMTLFDLLDPEDQRIAFGDFKTAIVLIGKTGWVNWTRKGCSQEICMALNLRSSMVLTKLDRTSPGPWSAHAALVGEWVRTKFPQLRWPSDNLEAYESLAALALRWRRYQCSPSVLTAQSRAIPAATPSRRSLLRIAEAPRPDPVPSTLGKAVRQGAQKQRNKTTGILNDIARALRAAGNSKDRIGEEGRRAKNLREALEDLDTCSDLRAANLKDVILQEVRLTLSNSPDKDEFSSLSGYLDDVLPALELLAPWDDLAALSCDEIQEWVESAKQQIDELKKNTEAVIEKQPRHFGLKRFLRSGKALGWDVPTGLFTDGGKHPMFSGMRKSAASVVVLERDQCNIRRLLQDHFEEWPVIAKRAVLAHDLLSHAPLRSAEQMVLRKNCIVNSIGGLSIEPDAFSHLKSMHARRIIKLPEELCDRMDSIVHDPEESANRFLFLSDDAKDWGLAAEINEALVSAATQVTGDACVRKHSFRAAAVAGRVWPEWEKVATALFQGDWAPAQYRDFIEQECERGFSHFILGTREAGHGHPLVILVHYCAPWPFLLAAQLFASLDGLVPDGSLIADSLGGTDSIRTARSRAKRNGRQFDVWNQVAEACLKKVNLPCLQVLDAPPIVTPRFATDSQKAPELIACVRFLAEVMLKKDKDQSAQDNGLALPLAHRLAASLPQGEECKTLLKRRRGCASDDSLADDRFFLKGEFSGLLIHALFASDPEDLKDLGEDLSHDRPNPRKSALGPNAFIAKMTKHLACLPNPTVGLQIRFSGKHPRAATPEMLVPLGERLVVGVDNDRIGVHPMFQVVEMRCVDNTRTTGRWTVATRVLVAAILRVNHFQKGNWQ